MCQTTSRVRSESHVVAEVVRKHAFGVAFVEGFGVALAFRCGRGIWRFCRLGFGTRVVARVVSFGGQQRLLVFE